MRRFLRASLALALIACNSTPASTPDAGTPADDTGPPIDAWSPPPPRVMTTSGPIDGLHGAGFDAFLGIPYAAPPVGDLRFRPPQAPTPWTMPRNTAHKPSACPQTLNGLRYGVEDCLYLNVHVPTPTPANAPVMVWIHGGAFALGEGAQADSGTMGDILAREHGVIVVSMNYRLGQLGFLAHPALDAESTDHTSGNYGFLDQVAALHWVHDNIAAFGGDPANVTIFGESAGGMSVCGHLAASASRGLYQRAIIESGPCGIPLPTQAAAEDQGMRFATALGCTSGDVLACLRAAPAATVVDTLGPSPAIISNDPMYASWGPTIDGLTFTENWLDTIRGGRAASVPTMIGWNQDEGRLFVALMEQTGAPPITDANYRSVVASLVGDANADAVIARYPTSMFGGDARFAAGRALGDAGLACPTRATAIALRDAGVPVHTYFFTYPDAHFLLAAPFPLGAFHSAEIQFVFGHPWGGSFPDGGDALRMVMSGYWARFASHDGDPNDASAVNWPAWDTMGTRLVLDRTVTVGHDDYADTCAFWETIPLP